MDIRGWPLDRILQLPDCCFGRRWLVGVAGDQPIAVVNYDISELALPESAVIWNLEMCMSSVYTASSFMKLALGDQLPVNDAMFDSYEPVFRDIGLRDGVNRYFHGSGDSVEFSVPLRQPLAAAGRRLVGRFEFIGAGAHYGHAILTISSIPTEVPDWLFSDNLRSR